MHKQPKSQEFDAIIFSDIHLGAEVCQAKQINHFLNKIHHKEICTKELIINGDIFDSWNFKRLKKHHWEILSKLRKLSDHLPTKMILGNHDGPCELLSHLIGIDIVEEYGFTSGTQKILCIHGHQFDEFIDKYPRLTKLADTIYRFISKIDKSLTWARSIKKASKTFMRNSEKIAKKSKIYAEHRGYNIVLVGHSHHCTEDLSGEVKYYNSGCWTENPCIECIC